MSRRRFCPPPPLRQPPSIPDLWSDGETSALLDAWGPRHLAGGGALRPGDWRACTTAVNSCRAASGRGDRSIDQCKNRMDYLKKRLKAECSKTTTTTTAPASASQSRLLQDLHRLRVLLVVASSSAPPGFQLRDVRPEVEEEEVSSTAPLTCDWAPAPKRRRTALSASWASPDSSSSGRIRGEGDGCTEMAAAVERLTKTYERVEAAKQREAARLERQRLEAMRALEIDRMRLLVELAIVVSSDS